MEIYLSLAVIILTALVTVLAVLQQRQNAKRKLHPVAILTQDGTPLQTAQHFHKGWEGRLVERAERGEISWEEAQGIIECNSYVSPDSLASMLAPRHCKDAPYVLCTPAPDNEEGLHVMVYLIASQTKDPT